MELGKISHLHLKKVNTYVQANTDAVTHVDAYLKKVDTNVNQSRSPHSLLSENLLPREWDVRLTAYPRGRLQVWSEWSWHTVCGHWFWNDDNGAATACKKLGYPNGGKIHRMSGQTLNNNDPIYIGACKPGEAIGQCTAGYNSGCGQNAIDCAECSRGTDAVIEIECLGSRQGEKDSFCGLDNSIIAAYLTPPKQVKEFISFAFGARFGIGSLSKSPHETCVDLGKVIGDVPVAWFGLATPDYTKNKLITGAATVLQNHKKCLQRGSDEATCKGKEADDKPKGLFKKLYSKIPIPLCMAVRPCDVYGNNLLRDWTFGIRFGEGLEIYTQPGVTITLNQLSYSSSGRLTTASANEDYPPLLEVPKHTSWGMNVFLEVGMTIPMATVGGKPKFAIEGIGGLGVLGKITLANGGEIRSPAQVFDYFLESGGDFKKMKEKIKGTGDSDPNQAFQSFEFELNVLLNGSIGLEVASLAPPADPSADASPNMIKIHTGARAVIQVRVDKDKGSSFQFWCSFRTEMRLSDLVKNIPVLKDIIPAVDVQVTARFYGGIMGSGGTDFVIALRAGLKIQCGAIQNLIKQWDTLMKHSTVASMDGLQKLGKMVSTVNDILDVVCDKYHSIGIQLRIRNTTIDKQQTYLELMSGKINHKLKLSDLPTCDPGKNGIVPSATTLDKAHDLNTAQCSSHSDCFLNVAEGEYNPYHTEHYKGNKGYCLWDPSMHTSQFCLGRCVRKIESGGDCSASMLNSPIATGNAFDVATEAALGLDQACASGNCVCGQCAQPSGKAAIDAPCAYSHDCESGWCEGLASEKTTCNGICRPKRKTGEKAYHFHPAGRNMDWSCESGWAQCETCVTGKWNREMPLGALCTQHGNCQSNNCRGSAYACHSTCRHP